MSDASIAHVFALLLLLQAKHLLADFVFQSSFILENRRRYGHPGGILHAAIHMAGTAIALVFVGGNLPVIALIVLAEGVVHYHIDWIKDNFTHARGLTPRDAAFWRAMGIDQCLHQATYVAVVMAWAAFAV